MKHNEVNFDQTYEIAIQQLRNIINLKLAKWKMIIRITIPILSWKQTCFTLNWITAEIHEVVLW